MKSYIKPEIDILLFDEVEAVTNASVATTAAHQLNEYFFDEKGVDTTTTIKLQDINVKQ